MSIVSFFFLLFLKSSSKILLKDQEMKSKDLYSSFNSGFYWFDDHEEITQSPIHSFSA